MPGGQITQRIASDQVKQLRLRVLLRQHAHRIYRVERRGALDIHPGEGKLRVIRDHNMQHRQPVIHRLSRLAWLMRWIRCEHPQYPLELELVLRFGSQDQVPQVWRIEGPAKDAQATQSLHSSS